MTLPGPSSNEVGFEEWLKWVFDHPVRKPEWYWDDGEDWCELYGRTKIEFMIRLFESPTQYLQDFSDAQAEQGFWFLTGAAALNALSIFLDQNVPWSERKRCIHSVYSLFANYFFVRCSRILVNITKELDPEVNPLNLSCFMWWDQLHAAELGDPSATLVNNECVTVMSKILELNHLACRESALHGLGHWQPYCKEKVEAVIDRFLNENPELNPNLLAYARAARTGRIL